MVVAIDGPAGAGKSTVARATARALGFTYLDSGAMYRAAALKLLEEGGAASERAEELQIEIGDRVLADGRDVTEAIRAPEVSEAASRIATNAEGASGARAQAASVSWTPATGWPRAATSAPSWRPRRR